MSNRYENRITSLTTCWRCENEITEYDKDTLLCEPCWNECKNQPAYFDRFDICEAWYCYAVLWPAGQYSNTYAIFDRLDNLHFKPSYDLQNRLYDALTDNGKCIFENLVMIGYQ